MGKKCILSVVIALFVSTQFARTPSKMEIDDFFAQIKKVDSSNALDKLSKNPSLALETTPFSSESPLDFHLQNIEKKTPQELNTNPAIMQLASQLIQENIRAHQNNFFKGMSTQEIKDRINKTITSPQKRAALHHITSQEKTSTTMPSQQITTSSFFDQFSQDQSEKIYNAIKIEPHLAGLITTEGNTTLHLTLKNYSGKSSEDKLIALIIELYPSFLSTRNKMGQTIFEIIAKHVSYIDHLSKLVRTALQKLSAPKKIVSAFHAALNNLDYQAIINFINNYPQLIYYPQTSGKTILFYIETAPNHQLDPIQSLVKNLAPHIKSKVSPLKALVRTIS